MTAEAVQFSFDPRCPWCYQTSRWALRLQALGRVELTWGVYCLELGNFDGPSDDFHYENAKSGPALRTAVTVREKEGQAACGRFYAAVGKRYFYDLQDLSEAGMIRGALEDAGLAAQLHDDAMDGTKSWEMVRADHEGLAEETGAFGVPFIRLDRGTGPGMFGPVISEPPADEEAVELFEHTAWLIRNANFHELKGGRSVYPDLPHIKRALAQRASGN
jgi:predicted DsbA family dithiol-disulfide isomerase